MSRMPRPPLRSALPLLAVAPSCAVLPAPHGDFVNTPYISRTVGAGVVDDGMLELEGMADIDPREKVKSIVKLNAGLGPGFELAVGLGPYYSAGSGADSHGMGDTTVTAKYKYADGENGFHGIVETEARLPTSDTGPSGRKGETDFLMATSLGAPYGRFSWVGTYELGMLGDPDTAGPVFEHIGVLAASWRAHPELRLFTEGTVIHEPAASTTALYAGGGGGLHIADGLELQAAAQLGLNEDAADLWLVFGFAWEMGSWRR